MQSTSSTLELTVHKSGLQSQVRRGLGCQQINAATYVVSGFTFGLVCEATWPVYRALHLSYTLDFAMCMQSCVNWNVNMTDKCAGVVWVSGNYGPHGVSGGSQCWSYWATLDNEVFSSAGRDLARLQGQNFPMVFLSSHT
jgi:hypothetical protein